MIKFDDIINYFINIDMYNSKMLNAYRKYNESL